jgi:hypothetical protein
VELRAGEKARDEQEPEKKVEAGACYRKPG